jgi:hypothetical protein
MKKERKNETLRNETCDTHANRNYANAKIREENSDRVKIESKNSVPLHQQPEVNQTINQSYTKNKQNDGKRSNLQRRNFKRTVSTEPGGHYYSREMWRQRACCV